jgi:CheY-like chemotaxis protein
MMLPGMDGCMFVRSLRGQRTFQHLPVVVVTAMDVREVAPKVRPLGVQHVIAKGDLVFLKLKSAMRAVSGSPSKPELGT